MKPLYLKKQLFIALLCIMIGNTQRSFSKPAPSNEEIDSLRLAYYMQALSAGLLTVSGYEHVRQIYYTELNLTVDNYYFMYYDDLIDQVKEQWNIDLKPEMNRSIKEYFNFNSDSDYIAGMYAWFNSFENTIGHKL